MAKFDVICESRQNAYADGENSFTWHAERGCNGQRVAFVALPDGTTLDDLRRAIGAGEATFRGEPPDLRAKIEAAAEEIAADTFKARSESQFYPLIRDRVAGTIRKHLSPEPPKADIPKCIDCGEEVGVYGGDGNYHATCERDLCTIGKSCSTPAEAIAAYRMLRKVEDEPKQSSPNPAAGYPYEDRRPKLTCGCDICVHLENVGWFAAVAKEGAK